MWVVMEKGRGNGDVNLRGGVEEEEDDEKDEGKEDLVYFFVKTIWGNLAAIFSDEMEIYALLHLVYIYQMMAEHLETVIFVI